jgi:hypothetical protein
MGMDANKLWAGGEPKHKERELQHKAWGNAPQTMMGDSPAHLPDIRAAMHNNAVPASPPPAAAAHRATRATPALDSNAARPHTCCNPYC